MPSPSPAAEQPVDPGAMAIVGLAGRFPGAKNVDELWSNLRNGVESIRRLQPEELREAGVPEERISDPDYVPATADLDDAKRFDASFFGYLPREAELMDPQHRHVLECAWQALESAGYDSRRYDGRIGVFGGVARNTYLLEILRREPDFLDRIGEYEGLIGGEKDFPATRVAYKLDLRGPALNVQTACSTSGVAVHLACQSLLSGECDMALAGGGRVLVPLGRGYTYQEGGILSPDGHCRAFDADAAGTIRGSGIGFVVLKRLEDALADRDTIHAVLRGTAVNNDGSDKVGFTAPSVGGQAEVIAEALAVAGVDADSIGYVETHGTATAVGDPIEIAALTRAFRETTDRTGFCPIGSVKTNLGHLDAGAAVTGIIKTALALENEEIPPSLHFRRPNPQIDFEDSPFFVNAERREWPREDAPRRAGVSSFGLGGTNFHAVLEEPPLPAEPAATERGMSESATSQLIPVSARTESALDEACENLARHLEDESTDTRLSDVAFTLQVGRRAMEHRRVVVADEAREAAAALSGRGGGRGPVDGLADGADRPVVFLFPGGGSQHVGMGRELHRSEPAYRRALERTLDAMDPDLGTEVRDLLLDADPSSDEATGLVERPSRALPALFATEYALARLLESWGVRAAAFVGHSLGEYTAATLAGVLSLDDAVQLVALRGRLFEELPRGAMTAVPLSAEKVRALEIDGVSVAAENRPSACVASGTVEAVDALEKRLAARGEECRRLHIDVAAHSHLVDSILDPFRDFLQGVRLHPPDRPFLSDVTGTWAEDDEVTDPEYWVRQLRHTVRFSTALETLFDWSPAHLLEVGPGRTLASFARFHPDRSESHPVATTMRHPTEEASDRAVLLEAVGTLWTNGVDIDWPRLHEGTRPRRVPLPTYPFQGDRHWAAPLERSDDGAAAAKAASARSAADESGTGEAGSVARGSGDVPAAERDAGAEDRRGVARKSGEGTSPDGPVERDGTERENGARPRDATRPAGTSALEQVLVEQIQTMHRQLRLLRARSGSSSHRADDSKDSSKHDSKDDPIEGSMEPGGTE